MAPSTSLQPKVTLAVSGGASIADWGGFNARAPGKILIQAGKGAHGWGPNTLSMQFRSYLVRVCALHAQRYEIALH